MDCIQTKSECSGDSNPPFGLELGMMSELTKYSYGHYFTFRSYFSGGGGTNRQTDANRGLSLFWRAQVCLVHSYH